MWSKERACDNPTPKHEGKDCVGEATEFGQCNVQPCIEDKIEECEQTLKRIPGFALGTPIEEVATLEDCYKECEKNPDCHAIVYSAKVSRCFLKVNGYEPPVAETVEGRDSTTIEMCCMNPESAKYCAA